MTDGRGLLHEALYHLVRDQRQRATTVDYLMQTSDGAELIRRADAEPRLRAALVSLVEAIQDTGLHEHETEDAIDLCLPIAGIKDAMHAACNAIGHTWLEPDGIAPYCTRCGRSGAKAP